LPVGTQPAESVPRLHDNHGARLEAAVLRHRDQLAESAFLAVLVLVTAATAVGEHFGERSQIVGLAEGTKHFILTIFRIAMRLSGAGKTSVGNRDPSAARHENLRVFAAKITPELVYPQRWFKATLSCTDRCPRTKDSLVGRCACGV